MSTKDSTFNKHLNPVFAEDLESVKVGLKKLKIDPEKWEGKNILDFTEAYRGRKFEWDPDLDKPSQLLEYHNSLRIAVEFHQAGVIFQLRKKNPVFSHWKNAVRYIGTFTVERKYGDSGLVVALDEIGRRIAFDGDKKLLPTQYKIERLERRGRITPHPDYPPFNRVTRHLIIRVIVTSDNLFRPTYYHPTDKSIAYTFVEIPRR